ncbi:CrcB family protein [Streptococcus ovuberis]|nr:CrcB family protein [Streptococcus ovuberis]
MRGMFAIPLVGALAYGLSFLGRVWLSNRTSVLLFNSSLAIATSGCLIKGIIEISGRSTTIDIPYWWTGFAFLALSGLVCLHSTRKQEDLL